MPNAGGLEVSGVSPLERPTPQISSVPGFLGMLCVSFFATIFWIDFRIALWPLLEPQALQNEVKIDGK